MTKLGKLVAATMILLAPVAILADDLTGADRLLCSVVQAVACPIDGECSQGPGWRLDIPRFVEIDLDKKTMTTTKASGLNRSTKAKSVERSDGTIVLHGTQDGRAFSAIITESTGMITLAIALDDSGVIIFGACTPLSK